MVTGIGMVNASAAVSVLLASERPSLVLNFGCAGAHRRRHPSRRRRDREGVVAHLSLTILPTGEERYAGFRFEVDGRTVLTDAIPADALSSIWPVSLHASGGPSPGPGLALTVRPPSIHIGIVASADCWTQDPVRIGGLHDLHGSLCEDMEAAAVAQVCAIFKTPMLAIKDISNNELHVCERTGQSGLPIAGDGRDGGRGTRLRAGRPDCRAALSQRCSAGASRVALVRCYNREAGRTFVRCLMHSRQAAAVNRARTTGRMRLSVVQSDRGFPRRIHASRRTSLPGARFRPFRRRPPISPRTCNPSLMEALRSRGIANLYTHQAAAFE